VIWGFWQATDLLQGYHLPEALAFRISFFRDLSLGMLIVAVLLLRPQGLLPEERRVSAWVDRRVRQRSSLAVDPVQPGGGGSADGG